MFTESGCFSCSDNLFAGLFLSLMSNVAQVEIVVEIAVGARDAGGDIVGGFPAPVINLQARVIHEGFQRSAADGTQLLADPVLEGLEPGVDQVE